MPSDFGIHASSKTTGDLSLPGSPTLLDVAINQLSNKRCSAEAISSLASSCSALSLNTVEGHHNNYIPNPKIHYILDEWERPAKMVCSICYDSELRFRSEKRGINDHTPSILPCDRVFGYECLRRWLDRDSLPSCPVCRLDCVYRGCGDPIPARPITKDNIHALPKTLPAGGEVADLCVECTNAANRKQAQERWNRLAVRWRVAATVADAETLRFVTARLDTVVGEVELRPKAFGLIHRW